MEYEKNIGISFKIISNQIRRVMDKKLGHNITNIQMFILGYIYENQNNKDIYQKDIEKLLNIRRSTTTEILNVMEKKDFVKRIESPSDKRQKIIVLSKKGKYYVG